MSDSMARHENWSEHQTTMFSSLHEKQKAGKFCDVVVKCKDSEQTFNAHSCVLSAASPVLDKLLQDAMDSSSVGPIEKILLVLPDDIASSCMESLINFIYSGNIDLSQTKPAVHEETARRKSKRSSSSSKTKSPEDGVATLASDDSTSIDISSLYAFLKASRCLEIHNLTEHLESAVTLSEMKMSDLASAGRPRRSSVSKNQSTSKPGSSDLPPIGVDNSKNGKTRKRKQQADKKLTESRTVKARSPKKRGTKVENVAGTSDPPASPPTIVVPLPSQLLAKDDGISDAEDHAMMELQSNCSETASVSSEVISTPVTKPSTDETLLYSDSLQTDQQKDESAPKNLPQNLEKFTCNTCKLTFKTKSSMNRHACQQPAEEQTRRVDSFPVTNRSSKKLQCPTCEKIFTSPSVYELHMKKHISEIEAALAERAKLTSGKPVQETPASVSEIQSETNQATVTEEKPKASETPIPTPERPPKRASAKKFQEMMKNAFSAHDNEYGNTMDSAKRKKRVNPNTRTSATKKMQKKSDICPAVEKIVTPQSESDAPVFHEMPGTGQVISGEDDAVEQNVTFSIPEFVEEYFPLGRMNVAEMITVGSKVCEDESSEINDSGSFELVESEELIQENILSNDQTSPMLPHVGEIIPWEDAQPPDETPPDAVDGTAPESDGKSPEKVKGTGTLEMCEICGIMVVNKKSHIKVHAVEKMKCEICGQGFRHKSSLMRHMKYHTSEGQECSVCKQRVFSPQEMQKHLDGHNVKKMRTECPVCKKSFTNQYVMKLHQRSHSGDEKYHCNICQRKFPYKSSLKTHMLLHSGERPYICSVCGKCFVQKIHAREHELQHAGIRRFQCPICNRFFAHKCGMTRHVTDIHHKMRPYTCETCGKSFPRKTKLIEHHRMHTGEKPYVCDICGVSYKANRSLKYHKKLRHNIVVKDYEVAIWRNGPLPDEYRSPPKTYPKPPPPRRKNKYETSTFAFPVSTARIETPMDKQEEENIINNIGTEVDVISTEAVHLTSPGSPDSTASKDDPPDRTQFHFNVPYQPSQYVTVTETPIYQATTLPPASTLTKIDQSSIVSGYLPLATEGPKTFIVPLNATIESGLPIAAGQGHVINSNQMPGMMVTYMMPSQVMERTELTPVNIAEVSGSAATTILERSASVPPMSTFRRHSNVTIPNVTNNAVVTPLPGMHTFTPVQLSAGQLTHPMISGFSSVPPGVSVFVPAAPVMSVAQATRPAPVQIHERPTEWQTEAYASADA